MIAGYSIVFWIAVCLFWLSAVIIFYSYLLFPAVISLLSSGRRIESEFYEPGDVNLPKVSLLIAVFNEEEVIEQKIKSIYKTCYPVGKMEVLIGSDNSTDRTNEILGNLKNKYPNLGFFPFNQRRGKGNVVNDLFEKSTGDIVLLTDANVMLEAATIYELVKYFKDAEIGLVDTQMVNTNMHPSGISHQEKAYISREVKIKQHESVLWGTMMGPFGGCFAIRRELYSPVPKNFLVDDFFINMKVLEQGYRCINNLNAIVYEDISNNLKDEFTRKVRISTGNFQNLRKFSHMLWFKTKGLSFCFISHKALRWIGPFFLVLAYLTNIYLAFFSKSYFYVFVFHSLLLLLPLLDIFLKKNQIHIKLLRFITHFYSMNLALLIGFFKSLNKIESNVWKPTQRNQA